MKNLFSVIESFNSKDDENLKVDFCYKSIDEGKGFVFFVKPDDV